MDFDLLSKTELKITKIALQRANLTDIAASVAKTLGLSETEVLVVDYLDSTMTLDVLNTCVNAHKIIGKKGELLAALGALPGVGISAETGVESDGMLGWIALEEGLAGEALARAERMAAEMRSRIATRALVYSTGREVAEGQIEDTNGPAIRQCFEAEGYGVTQGPTLPDDEVLIAARLRDAAENGGYGVIITTGGVGAEAKDCTVEAVKTVDPEAATPYICHYRVGTGRHVKDGIRIAVGLRNGTLIVALPGPNDEVRASLPVLLEGLGRRDSKQVLAESLAANLRVLLREKTAQHH